MTSLPVNRILHGECIEMLGKLPDASVDVIFADPPYNLQLQQALYRPNRTKVDAVMDAWDRFSTFKEYDTFTRRWLAACRRVLKDTGTIWVIGSYHNIYRVGAILQDLDFWILNDIIWVKTNPMPNFRGVRFTNAHETLIWAQKSKGSRYTFNYKSMKALNEDLQMRSDWIIPLSTGRERIKSNGTKAHPTQKPEALLYRVVLSSTNQGDVILDPFFGSGTTGAVAKKLRRKFIGIEQDGKYIRIAQERIRTAKAYPADSLMLAETNRNLRLPFGMLLENGMLKTGQTLYLSGTRRTASILANGHIKCGSITGSIHSVAKHLSNTPANGWEVWLYRDTHGRLKPINELRETLRADSSKLHPSKRSRP